MNGRPPHLGIRARVVFSALFAVTFALLIGATFDYFRFVAVLKGQILHDDAIKIQQTVSQMNYYVADVTRYASSMVVDPVIQQYATTKTYKDFYSRLVAETNLTQRLRQYSVLRDYIVSSALVSEDGSVLWTDEPYDDYFLHYLREPWYQDIPSNQSAFSKIHLVPSLGDHINDLPVISYVLRFRSLHAAGEPPANSLILNLDASIFKRIIETAGSEFDGIIWANSNGYAYISGIPNRELRQLTKSNLVAAAPPVPDVKAHAAGAGYLLVDDSFDNGWRLAAYVSPNRLYPKVQFVLFYLLILVGVADFMSVTLFYPLVSSITRPLRGLLNATRRVGDGDLDFEIKFEGHDEIASLGREFSFMVNNLRRLREDTRAQEEQKRLMSAELLLAQINPHFVYNTLNSVVFLARKRKSKLIEQMVEAFISVLQDSVRMGDNSLYTTVRRELSIVAHYCEIQRIRYPDQFQITKRIDESLMDATIPRSCLQPLVENSIFHGLVPTGRMGTIELSVFRRDSQIVLRVKDDGIGMTTERIREILESRNSPEQPGPIRNIGLRNIRDRLKFLYGEHGSLHIDRESDHGTTVEISVPIPDR